jgi:hypothetical protein
MFPWYGGTNMLDDGWELPEDDKMAIQSLYGEFLDNPEVAGSNFQLNSL